MCAHANQPLLSLGLLGKSNQALDSSFEVSEVQFRSASFKTGSEKRTTEGRIWNKRVQMLNWPARSPDQSSVENVCDSADSFCSNRLMYSYCSHTFCMCPTAQPGIGVIIKLN